MNNLIHKDSLRSLFYKRLKESLFLASEKEKSLTYKIKRKLRERRGEKTYLEKTDLSWVSNNIICPQCLKSNLIVNFLIECPFCHATYNDHKRNCDHYTFPTDLVKRVTGYNFRATFPLITAAIFHECLKCHAKIRYISCQHCQKPIDLFEPYDRKALERKRYE